MIVLIPRASVSSCTAASAARAELAGGLEAILGALGERALDDGVELRASGTCGIAAVRWANIFAASVSRG